MEWYPRKVDSDNINTFGRTEMVDNAIVINDNFPNIFVVEFRDDSPELWHLC